MTTADSVESAAAPQTASGGLHGGVGFTEPFQNFSEEDS